MTGAENILMNSAFEYRELNDAALLEQCRLDQFRGPGPGGQKRNKTSNSVRLTHTPTGITVIAGESRSLSENKMRALRRLKMELAIQLRRTVDPRGWEPPTWMKQVTAPVDKRSPGSGFRLQISHRHPVYFLLAGLSLDLIESLNGSVSDAAALLGVSTSSLVKFLTEDRHLWAAVNRIRVDYKHPPLKQR